MNRDPGQLVIDSLLKQTQYTKHPLDLLDEIQSSSEIEANVFLNIFQVMQLLGFVSYRSMVYQNRFYGKSPAEIRAMRLPPSMSFALHSQMSIHNMLRIVLLKRFESSVYALKRSLEKYEVRLDEFSQNLEQGYITAVQDVQAIKDEFGDDLEIVTEDGMQADYENRINLNKTDGYQYNLEALRADIAKDRAILKVLLKACQLIESKDDKLAAFAELLNKLIENPPAGRKILVF